MTTTSVFSQSSPQIGAFPLTETNHHDRQVVRRIVVDGMIQQYLGGFLRICLVADQVDCFLVLGNVPQLSLEQISGCHRTRLQINTYPITSDNQELVIDIQRRLRSEGRTHDKLFHTRVTQRSRNSKDA
jgi:hypothetical protein